MHSVAHRLNAVVTFAGLLLAVISVLASVSDSFNSPSVVASAQVVRVNRFRKQLSGNDEVSLTLNITADMQSTFTWNTKQVFVFLAAEYESEKNTLNQVSLWDHIIPDKDHAKFQTQVLNKYPLIDQAGYAGYGSHLRGKEINLVLHWHVMPKTGRMIRDQKVLSQFNLPKAYL